MKWLFRLVNCASYPFFFFARFCLKGGSFESDQAFEGSLSRVNVWNFAISPNTIKEMSRGCGLWSGNAVSWYNFKNNIFGNIEIDTPSSCSLPGEYQISGAAMVKR